MIKPLRIVFAITAITCLVSCKGLSMKEEQTFAANVSSMVNGLPVTVSAAAGVSTEKGSYRRLEIEIDNYVTVPQIRDYQLTYATSIPAFLYFRDSALRKKNYDQVQVTVKEGKNESVETFTLKDLEQVDRCVLPYNGFAEGLRTMNKDSLRRYADASLWEQMAIDSVIAGLKEMEEKYGQATSIVFGGFKKNEGGKSFTYPFLLERPKLNHRIIISIDPLTKKVIYFRI